MLIALSFLTILITGDLVSLHFGRVSLNRVDFGILAPAIDVMIFGLEPKHLGLFEILIIFLPRNLWR